MGDAHLGIHLGRARSAALVRDGALQLLVAQEQLDRRRGSPGHASGEESRAELPREAIKACLDGLGLEWSQLSSVTAHTAGWESGPERLAADPFLVGGPTRLRIGDHHLALAHAAFFPSPFEDALVLIVDDAYTHQREERRASAIRYALYHGQGARLHRIAEGSCPALYAPLESAAGFSAHLAKELSTLRGLNEDWSDINSLADLASGSARYVGSAPWWRVELRGAEAEGARERTQSQGGEADPLDSGLLSFDAYRAHLEWHALRSRAGGREAQLQALGAFARRLHQEAAEAFALLLRDANQRCGARALCLGGSLALDPAFNHTLLKESGLEALYAFPAPGALSVAAGCALWAHLRQPGAARPRSIERSDLGMGLDPRSLEEAALQLPGLVQAEPLELLKRASSAAERLARGELIARFEGGGEIGAIALQRGLFLCPRAGGITALNEVACRPPEARCPLLIPEEMIDEFFEPGPRSPEGHLLAQPRPGAIRLLQGALRGDGAALLVPLSEQRNPSLTAICHQLRQLHGTPPALLSAPLLGANGLRIEQPAEALIFLQSRQVSALYSGDFVFTARRAASSGAPPLLPQGETLGLATSTLSAPAKQHLDALDRALFSPAREELRALEGEQLWLSAALIAPYRERSRAFGPHPLGSHFSAHLELGWRLRVDPTGDSLLEDELMLRPPRHLSYEELRFLSSLRSAPSEPWVQALRCQLRYDHRGWRQALTPLRASLELLGIVSDEGWRGGVHPVEPLPLDGEPLLAPLRGDGDAARPLADALAARLEEIGYTEEALARWRAGLIPPGEGRLSLAIELFLMHQPLSSEALREALGESLLQQLRGARLVDEGGRALFSIDRVGALFSCSDWMREPQNLAGEEPISPPSQLTLGLLAFCPTKSLQRALDFSGSGGVIAAHLARSSAAVDCVVMSERARRFAQLTLALNGAEGVSVILASEASQRLRGDYDFIVEGELGAGSERLGDPLLWLHERGWRVRSRRHCPPPGGAFQLRIEPEAHRQGLSLKSTPEGRAAGYLIDARSPPAGGVRLLAALPRPEERLAERFLPMNARAGCSWQLSQDAQLSQLQPLSEGESPTQGWRLRFRETPSLGELKLTAAEAAQLLDLSSSRERKMTELLAQSGLLIWRGAQRWW